ncbi:hypothetical protein [Mycoplasma zalophidermidis]|uniref:Uncharacterized protein n=2 Tax=Mycoplasma zalophidermidis TaxID=398174 RepID=A0ABS6DSP7_9MOLU|nr:hypothetical protein [Mycoplasma zalophidermidis]MBU4693620.1 hypothetical protein [Mycoplasma zalophidermidis]MCR8966705.1 hypothetical protein [Mycoplasma zalophidermidis]
MTQFFVLGFELSKYEITTKNYDLKQNFIMTILEKYNNNLQNNVEPLITKKSVYIKYSWWNN